MQMHVKLVLLLAACCVAQDADEAIPGFGPVRKMLQDSLDGGEAEGADFLQSFILGLKESAVGRMLPEIMSSLGAMLGGGQAVGGIDPAFVRHIVGSTLTGFAESELGRTLWRDSGLEASFKLFTLLFTNRKTGRLQTERIFGSLENAVLRPHLIKSLSSFGADWVKRVADLDTQARYLATAQLVCNDFLKAQGFPKATRVDLARPAESLPLLVNAVFERLLGLQVNSAGYIELAVPYIQLVLKMAQNKVRILARHSSGDIESLLAETLDGEVLDPVLRVWRAYRYSTTKAPSCGAYVMCVINKPDPTERSAGIKTGVTKLSSVLAAWLMSGNSATPYSKLYNAATEDQDCEAEYLPLDACCADFFKEDARATTKRYAHTEL